MPLPVALPLRHSLPRLLTFPSRRLASGASAFRARRAVVACAPVREGKGGWLSHQGDFQFFRLPFGLGVSWVGWGSRLPITHTSPPPQALAHTRGQRRGEGHMGTTCRLGGGHAFARDLMEGWDKAGPGETGCGSSKAGWWVRGQSSTHFALAEAPVPPTHQTRQRGVVGWVKHGVWP